MNENEILDNPNMEDINIEIESDNIIENDTEEILETASSSDELDLDIIESEDVKILDEAIDENIVDESIENNDKFESEVEDISIEDVDISEDKEEVSMLEIDDEKEIEELSEDNSTEELDITSEEESIEEDAEILDEVVVESEDENFITNDLDNINIEFGIEAKGFILSLKMMEAMIEKGYIFKDILNDKVFDAVMIFNGNLENTVVTNDIKIKIEDGKIQLIKG